MWHVKANGTKNVGNHTYGDVATNVLGGTESINWNNVGADNNPRIKTLASKQIPNQFQNTNTLGVTLFK